MLRTEYTFIRFVEQPKPPERKTPRWACMNKKHGAVLGTIAWCGAWRQFCFYPAGGGELIFSAGCLDDVRDFIEQANKAWRF